MTVRIGNLIKLYHWTSIVIVVMSWLAMQWVHELGHIAGAWMTGGHVVAVELRPWMISRTDVSPNPHPLFVTWSGPVIGVVLPLLTWGLAIKRRSHWRGYLQFWAGFGCIANGLYIGIGSFDRVGDCRELLAHGADIWHLWRFGLLMTPLGLWLWHRV
jgi:hypothetical protein